MLYYFDVNSAHTAKSYYFAVCTTLLCVPIDSEVVLLCGVCDVDSDVVLLCGVRAIDHSVVLPCGVCAIGTVWCLLRTLDSDDQTIKRYGKLNLWVEETTSDLLYCPGFHFARL